jgi:GNAT superfamily N-acetyltransferase
MFEVPDRINYVGSKIVACGPYLLGLERIEDMQAEIEKLHSDHFYETETRFLDETLDPDYDYALAMELRGAALFFTVRHRDEFNMVGNAMLFLGPCLHMKRKMQAVEDTFFLSEGHRGAGLADAFLAYIRQTLKGLGIDYLWMSDKAPSGGKSLKKLFEHHGFKPIATAYLLGLQAHSEE